MKPVKLLIITGGHSFDQEAFYAMFDSFAGVEYDTAWQPGANRLYKSKAKDYDLLVFYDMVQNISAEQQKDLLDLAKKGENMLFLHHALVSYNDWPEFFELIGGRYHQKEQVLQGSKRSPSTYRHDVSIPVKIEDPEHPVAAGISNFTLFDEVYGGFSVHPEVKVLLSTNHPESTEAIAWTKKFGKSDIVYIQPGHGKESFEDPNYRKLLKNTIDWLTR